MDKQIVEYNITDAAIAEMSSLYMGLKVMSLDDQEGFEAVHSGRMVVKGKRVEVEKRRKELKADALKWGKKVDSEANRIFDLLKPIEDYLQAEEDKVTKEKERIKAEQFLLEKLKIQGRVNTLLAVNVVLPFFDLAVMSDNSYEKLLAEKTEAYKTEQAFIAEQETARKTEAERLEKVRLEQDTEAKRLADIKESQETKEAELKKERERFEAEKKAAQAKIELAEIKKKLAAEAKIKAEKDAIAKIEFEKKEEADRLAVKKVEIERKLELAPDKEKLSIFADKIQDLTAGNLNLKSKAARELFSHTINGLLNIETTFRVKIDEL